MTSDDLKQAVFGASDGATTTLGIIGALWFSGHSRAIPGAVIGAAIAATVGMAGSEYISDPESSVHRASIMGAATLVGSVEPALPLFFGHSSLLLVTCAALALVLGGVVSTIRAKQTGWTLALGEVYGIFVVVAVLTTVVGLVFPGAS